MSAPPQEWTSKIHNGIISHWTLLNEGKDPLNEQEAWIRSIQIREEEQGHLFIALRREFKNPSFREESFLSHFEMVELVWLLPFYVSLVAEYGRI